MKNLPVKKLFVKKFFESYEELINFNNNNIIRRRRRKRKEKDINK